MSVLGNIIWLVFGGLFSAIGYFAGGLVFCMTIIGIPFGIQSFKIGLATLLPFGTEIYELPDANSPLRLVFNALWLITFGITIALNHLFWAVVLGITIIGLPFAGQHLKLVPLSLLPFGRELRRR